MADLAAAPGRRAAQRRITNNRDGVLPSRRQTDAPSVAIRADLRTATRGDGGADELRRTLGMLSNAAADFGQARVQADQELFSREATDGLGDALAGREADPALAASRAYQEAFYRVRTESRFNAFSATTKNDIDQALNDGADPADVDELMQTRTAAFLKDEIDQLPATASVARRETATRLMALAGELDTTVNERIRERTKQDFITTAQGNIRTALEGGQDLDFESYVSTLRDGNLPPAEAKARAMEAVMAVALDRDNPRPELLERLVDSRQRIDLPADAYAPQGPITGLQEPGNIDLTNRTVVHNEDGSISTLRSISAEFDGREVLIPTVTPEGRLLTDDEAIARYKRTGEHLGVFNDAASANAYAARLHEAQAAAYGRRERATPSLSAIEQMNVLDRITQARSLRDQRERQEREDRRDALMDAWLPRVLDGEIVDDEIIAAGREGVLEPQELVQYLGLTDNLRNAPNEGHENEDFVLEVTRRSAMGDPPSNGQVLAWARQGRFGTGRAGQRAAIRFLHDSRPVGRGGGAAGSGGAAIGLSARAEATRNVATARRFMWEQTEPEAPSRYQGEMLVLQEREFNRRVRAGEDPFATAQDLVNRNRGVILRDRAPTPPPLPSGNRTVAPGNYTWPPS